MFVCVCVCVCFCVCVFVCVFLCVCRCVCNGLPLTSSFYPSLHVVCDHSRREEMMRVCQCVCDVMCVCVSACVLCDVCVCVCLFVGEVLCCGCGSFWSLLPRVL